MPSDILEEIRAVEEEIRRTPYNKATEAHIGRLKAKLARLRREAAKQRKSGEKQRGVRKAGDATVALVGFPSVGKSTLLNALTNANSRIEDYYFTTLDAVPGMFEVNGAKIQVLDLPGVVEGAASGKGRGKEVFSMIRMADMLLLMVDALEPEYQLKVLRRELYEAGIRTNKTPPNVEIRKRDKGGLAIKNESSLADTTIREILKEYKIHNAEVFINEEITVDELIDVLEGNRKYVPALVVVNKIDLLDEATLPNIENAIYISAKERTNLETLRNAIFDTLGFIRVYLKPPGGEPSKEPMILRRGATVEDVCRKIHNDVARKFKYARVWGRSVKYDGQHVGLSHELCDGDVVTIIARK
ncbi:MAG: Ribosome-interacting GTPase RBG1 [Candidatus Alkanophagales archaeon MCA70_species_1]|nr:Ribosome-interacting GTPase RBG1 [Candidatus Alkanophaga volatiphilum]